MSAQFFSHYEGCGVCHTAVCNGRCHNCKEPCGAHGCLGWPAQLRADMEEAARTGGGAEGSGLPEIA